MEEVFKRALSQYGLKEIAGERHNPQILQYFQVAGHKWVQNDELAWCSAFVNWCAREENFESTGKLNARSWLDVGLEVNTPEIGDLVIYWRVSKDSVYGHVGFYINTHQGYIYTLGGNQGNMVNITPYPEYRLLGYRRLRKKKMNGGFMEVPRD
jgi:uncharacterized protein (TIGR02594 family)